MSSSITYVVTMVTEGDGHMFKGQFKIIENYILGHREYNSVLCTQIGEASTRTCKFSTTAFLTARL